MSQLVLQLRQLRLYAVQLLALGRRLVTGLLVRALQLLQLALEGVVLGVELVVVVAGGVQLAARVREDGLELGEARARGKLLLVQPRLQVGNAGVGLLCGGLGVRVVDDGLLGGLARGVAVLDGGLHRAGHVGRRAQGQGVHHAPAVAVAVRVGVWQGAEEAADLLVVGHGAFRGRRAVLAADRGAVGVDGHRGRGCCRRLEVCLCLCIVALRVALLAGLSLSVLRGQVQAASAPAPGFLARLDLGRPQVGGHPVGHVHGEVVRALDLARVDAVGLRPELALHRRRLEGRVQPQGVQVHLILRSVLGAALEPWAVVRGPRARRAGRVRRVCARHYRYMDLCTRS